MLHIREMPTYCIIYDLSSFRVAKTSLCSKKTGIDIAMNFKYYRLPSKEKERGYTVVII